VLNFKFCLRFHRVAATTNDCRVELLELLDGVTKLGRFVRSTGRVRLRIEVQDEVFAPEIAQRHLFAIVGGYAKVRSLVAFL